VKARTFIITIGATLALVVPAAQAANTSNRLYQTKIHTILAEKTAVKNAKSAQANARAYQTEVHTVLAEKQSVTASKSAKAAYARAYKTWLQAVELDKSVGAIGSLPAPPKPPASSQR
jgi:hypothetical protein